MKRSFENLMNSLDQEVETRMVFDIGEYRKVLEHPQLRDSNVKVWLYLCVNVPFNEKIPPPEKIAGDTGLEIKTVKEEIEVLKNYGVLTDRKNDKINVSQIRRR